MKGKIFIHSLLAFVVPVVTEKRWRRLGRVALQGSILEDR